MNGKLCVKCGNPFLPKEGGHRALYCSKKCKNRVRKQAIDPEAKKEIRKRRYTRIVASPNRYAKHLSQSKKSRKKVLDWLAEYKVSRGCVDCGYDAHFAALQLDHTGAKTLPIAACRSSIWRLQEEIERGKCVVRCGNCHAVKTWERKMAQNNEQNNKNS